MDSLLPEEIAASWRKPWISDPENQQSFEDELWRECAPEHVLHGARAVPVAYRCDCDDVLFRLENHSARYAVVHLTYDRETNPQWPETELFSSLVHFMTTRLREDVENYHS